MRRTRPLLSERRARARAHAHIVMMMMMAAIVITPRRASTRRRGHDAATPNRPAVTSF